VTVIMIIMLSEWVSSLDKR